MDKNELLAMLEKNPALKQYLFIRGFIITNKKIDNLSEFPFYGNWSKETIYGFNFIVQKENNLYTVKSRDAVLFLIGHCFNPFDMEYDENCILKKLADLDDSAFWEYEANLTGIYVMGRITQNGNLTHWSDCAGMRISYYGHIGEYYIITSHVNLAACLFDLTEDMYIKELKNSKYFHLFGNVLPADCSAYLELSRTVPNHYYMNGGTVKRFFPIVPIVECNSEAEYQNVLEESARILRNTLSLCAKKWADKRIAISVTGGKDSGETLASAAGVYDSFSYFSYISKPEERVDAEAAREICKCLGLKHRIIDVPLDNDKANSFDVMDELIFINGGNIGHIKPNEVRKRCLLADEHNIDIEIKSWVNEIVRAYWYKKYSMEQFPKKPTGKYLAALYKVFIENRKLYRKTAKVFDGYIQKYMTDDDIYLIGDWTSLWSWEFGFSAGEGQSLFAEHMLSYDITIPFNNRHLISLMLRPKLQDRINDRLQKDIIRTNNPKQAELNISIVNAAHTSKRAFMEKAYLFVNTHLPF